MGEIVNLNKARKAARRAAEVKRADVNRVAHGRTKAERDQAKAEADRARARHATLKIEDEPSQT